MREWPLSVHRLRFGFAGGGDGHGLLLRALVYGNEVPEIVRFPSMREYIIEAVYELSDETYQRHVWVERRFDPELAVLSLGDTLNLLFDDSGLMDFDPIGITLRDEREAAAVDELLRTLGALSDRLHHDAEAVEFRESGEWPTVVAYASRALMAFPADEVERVRRKLHTTIGYDPAGP